MKAQHNCIQKSEGLDKFCQKLISLAIFASLLLFFSIARAAPLNITVTASDGTTNVPNYRWLLEEDLTFNTVPSETCLNGNYSDCQALNFHKSYMPIVAEGNQSDTMPELDPLKRYYVSILPDANHSIGGTKLAAGETLAEVTVTPSDVPTAQIRVYVFNDLAPTNGAPDTPQETGIAGMKITVEDAGGRYGASGQHIVNDVYGNPLGTTYSAQGVVDVMGDGNIYTGPDGFVTIKNLAPAKYGIQAVPIAGSPLVQTSTIEGSKLVDAWVKADEPPFFIEFGPPGPHVFIGFTQQFTDATVLTGGATITGKVTSLHNSRPPEFSFHSGAPVGDCWVALNESAGGISSNSVFAAPCDGDSNFSIPDVPEGNYQLVIWDTNLSYIIAAQAITVAQGATTVALGDVAIFAWFARLEQKVFHDANENGIWDAGESPLPEQGTGIRWRDGTVYQGFPTDLGGEAPYDQVFPFFSWLVAEVAFDRFKATGVTVRVDDGGSVAPGEVMNPQPQNENSNLGFRVETGPVLTQAFQAFAGQTNVIEWGKTPYAVGENGGISGIVYYATTRAEDDPRYAGAEPWEPGIPRIQVALYQDSNDDGIIDDLNGDTVVTLADVDNAPFGNFPGAEDFDYNGNTENDAGDAIQVGTTDSWDDNIPTNCQGDAFIVDGVYATDCFDGLRNFNQVRPGVFDGGYAFDSYFPGGVDSGSIEVDTLPSGIYIVATGDHKTYKTLKEEDRNVDFGDNFIIPNLLPPICVGNDHLVPNIYSLFDSGEAPFYAGDTRPLCDSKRVSLSGGKNAAADFYMFTLVPKAAHVVGTSLNDLSNEFDPNAPAFGEKFAPPFLPVSIRDWTGNEVSRTYTDRWGQFNALVPSMYTNNLPSSSGMSPNMLTACMNDPGPIKDVNDVNGALITDPGFKREYSQFCYTLQYLPGVTTFLDTPVLPIAAFTGQGQFPLDCQYPTGTPVIWSTTGSITGPYVTAAGDTLTIVSAGDVEVKNPDFSGSGTSETIDRDFGFGPYTPNNGGSVTIGGNPATILAWDNDTITVTVPTGTVNFPEVGGQLQITRENGLSTQTGIYVTVGGSVVSVTPGGSIQDAIDLAPPQSTVIIPPGTYNEPVVMWKPIRLQGSGASTVINAASSAGTIVEEWRSTVAALVNDNQSVDLLPVQGATFDAETLNTEQAAGIIVLAKNNAVDGFSGKGARIDGISIQGSNLGGGIVVNGYAHDLEISNNRLFNNFGIYGGGIRVGHSIFNLDGINTNINIHHNYVAENGGSFGAGGGISLYSGSDYYNVSQNYVCGNFMTSNGGGIGHFGKSLDGQISNNTILFNQSFNQGTPVAGGGIFVGGALEFGALTDGSGSVTIDGNLIQGNNAGAGDGGGISLSRVNGADAVAPNDDPSLWYSIDITNNKIVNNVSGLAGGGISLQDAAMVNISNNTIAHNDTTGTSGEAFCDTATGLVCDPNQSTARAAGVVAYKHSGSLATVISTSLAATPFNVFSNPNMVSNIIWENRSFYFLINNATVPSTFGLVPDITGGDPAVFSDLAVYPISALNRLDPLSGILTNTAGYDASNTNADPNFIFDYFNGEEGTSVDQVELTTGLSVQPAFDEGGNFIEVRYGPLTALGDYTDNVIQAPVAANLVSPSGNIGAINTPEYKWDAIPGGPTEYKLIVWDPAAPTIRVIDETYSSNTVLCSTGTVCTITPPYSLANGSYRWRIRTKNSLGWGPWSSILSFTVGVNSIPPVATTLVSPTGNVLIDTPTYIWNKTDNTTDYRLIVWDPADSSNRLVDSIYAAVGDPELACNGAICEVTPPNTLVDGSYKYRVRTKNAFGWGPSSSILSFTVGANSIPPVATTLVSPTGNVLTDTPTYIWNETDNTTDYRLIVWDPSDQSNRLVDITYATVGNPELDCNGTTCQVTPSIALVVGSSYRFRVKTKNAFGWGPWSNMLSPFNVVAGP